MSGDPKRGPDPGCLSSFLPRGFGFPNRHRTGPLPQKVQSPPGNINDGGQNWQLASVRQIEQLSDRLLVCCRELVLIHVLWRDPAVVVHLLVVDVALRELAPV